MAVPLTVISRTSDEKGTTTVTTGGGSALTIAFVPHETLPQKFERIVDYVRLVTTRPAGINPDWQVEDITMLGLHMRAEYAAGVGLRIVALEHENGPVRNDGFVARDDLTMDTAGQLYGAVLNRACDISQERRDAQRRSA